MSIPIALQLYTIRDPLGKNTEATIAKVAEIGYKYVENAGLHGQTPEQWRKLLDKHGLKICGAHVGVDQLQNNIAGAIQEARTMGYDLITCPYAGDEYRTKEGWHRLAGILEEAGKKAADAGMRVSYHNHNFEFPKFDDGTCGLEILYDTTDPKYVGAELDLYWVKKGGDDPLAWVNKLAGRLPLLHVKDMEKGGDRNFAEVGTGQIDFKPIIAAAPKAGVRYYVIEQDNNWIDNDSMKSAKISYDNFKKMVS